ncbi:MAG: hypothetical protein GY751_17595, partial [Bacteroidetes bacterium]|nr:hypothetical protein [Bacteroidota bacterium]
MVMSQESTLENETPSPTTDTIPLTQTQAVLEKICAYSLEMPIGVSSQLLLHKVKGGESMAMLAENYETTEETIDIVNYFMPSPLWAELIIVIPVGTTEISDISSLKPVFVDYDDILLDELADSLSVSAEDIIRLNHIDTSCTSFYGWILIPAEKIVPSP